MFVGAEYLQGEDGDGGKIFNEHFTYCRSDPVHSQEPRFYGVGQDRIS